MPVLSVLQEQLHAQAVQQDITLILALLSASYALQAPIPPTEERVHAFLARKTRTVTQVQLRVAHVIKGTLQGAEQLHAKHALQPHRADNMRDI